MSTITVKSHEQKDAEFEVESFRKDLGPFVAATERTRLPMVFTDAKDVENPIIFANDSFLAMTGYDREELLGKRFSFVMARGVGSGSGSAAAQVDAALGGGSDCTVEIACRRKGGVLFWAAVYISAVHDAAGEVVQRFASFVDLTSHRREEDRLRFMLDELNHRTQNTLATVQAIAAQTFRAVVPRDVIDAFQARILALSKTHGLLGRTNWDAVSLRDTIDQALQPFGLNDRWDGRFSVEGDDLTLQPKTALTLAMMFHELATNATAYGALADGAEGRIVIAWKVEPSAQGGRMRLQWEESGGPPVTPPDRKGFGSRLIEGGLAQELDGEVSLDYRAAGVICEVVMPLNPAMSR